MQIIDFNGEGRWSRDEIRHRYSEYAHKLGINPRDLSPVEHVQGTRKWIFPVMQKVIEGIEAGDSACILLGIEFIQEDTKFPFGKILKSNTARALRRSTLTVEQKDRIRRRVLDMLRKGHVPHEFKEYSKLLRHIGFDVDEVRAIAAQSRFTSPRVWRFFNYFTQACQSASEARAGN